MKDGKTEFDANRLAGNNKVENQQSFPVNSLSDVLASIRRAGGTGKLEINFKNGHARGDAKWQGVVRE